MFDEVLDSLELEELLDELLLDELLLDELLLDALVCSGLGLGELDLLVLVDGLVDLLLDLLRPRDGISVTFDGLLERLPDGEESRPESSKATPLSVWCVVRRLDIARSISRDMQNRG